MKIQLDTTAKTISVEESVNLGMLIDALDKLLPDDLWKQFTLETKTIIHWSDPIILPQPYPVYPMPIPLIPYTPPYSPWITYKTDIPSLPNWELNPGTYCIDLTTTTIQ